MTKIELFNLHGNLRKFQKRIYKLHNLKKKWFIDLILNVVNNEWLIYELVLNDQMFFECTTTMIFV